MELIVEASDKLRGSGYFALNQAAREQIGVELTDAVRIHGPRRVLPLVVAPRSGPAENTTTPRMWIDSPSMELLGISSGDRIAVDRFSPARAQKIVLQRRPFAEMFGPDKETVRANLHGRVLSPEQPTVPVGSEQSGVVNYRLKTVEPAAPSFVDDATNVEFVSGWLRVPLIVMAALLDLFVSGVMVLGTSPRYALAATTDIPFLSAISILSTIQDELLTVSYVLTWTVMCLLLIQVLPIVLQPREDLSEAQGYLAGLAVAGALFGVFLETHIAVVFGSEVGVSWTQNVGLNVVFLVTIVAFLCGRGTLPTGGWRAFDPWRALREGLLLLGTAFYVTGRFAVQYAGLRHLLLDKQVSKPSGATEGVLKEGQQLFVEFWQWVATVAAIGALLASVVLFWPVPDVLVLVAWFGLPIGAWCRKINPLRSGWQWLPSNWRDNIGWSRQTADLGEHLVPTATVCWRDPAFLVVPLYIAGGVYLLLLFIQDYSQVVSWDSMMTSSVVAGVSLAVASGLCLFFWLRVVAAVASSNGGVESTLPTAFVIGTAGLGGVALSLSDPTVLSSTSVKSIGAFLLSSGFILGLLVAVARIVARNRLDWYYVIPVGFVLLIAFADSGMTLTPALALADMSFGGSIRSVLQQVTADILDSVLLLVPAYVAPRAVQVSHTNGWEGLRGWAAGLTLVFICGYSYGFLRQIAGDGPILTALLVLSSIIVLPVVVRSIQVLILYWIPGLVGGVFLSVLTALLLPADSIVTQLSVTVTSGIIAAILLGVGFVLFLALLSAAENTSK